MISLILSSPFPYGPGFIFLLGKKAGTGGHEAWFPSWSWNKVSKLPSGQVLHPGDQSFPWEERPRGFTIAALPSLIPALPRLHEELSQILPLKNGGDGWGGRG